MKTKKGSPSGVGCRIHAATKSKPIFLTGIGFSQSVLRLLIVLLVLPMAWMNAWGLSGSQTFHATSAETAKGLVYANNSASANPSINDYTSPSAATKVSTNGNEGMPFASYAWAMPARGYDFVSWAANTNGNTAPSGETYNAVKPSTNTGSGDEFTTTVPRQQTHHGWTMANFAVATGYNVVYKQPEGGNYTVQYIYYTVNESTKKFKNDGETLQLTSTSGDLRPTDPRDASNHKTYPKDSIILTATEGNFIAWYKDGVELSKSNPYTKYKADDDAEISALFQYIVLGEAGGELTVNATTKDTYNRTVYVPFSQKIGPWTASDFTISPKNPDGADASNDYGTIEFGAITIDETNNRLVIPYAYTATDWGGISVDVTVAPPAGAGTGTQFTIACSAEEVVAYEACIEESGVRTYTGTLAAMMTQANSMNNKPTLKLMNPVTITSPLSFTQSFTFDANGKVLTANCASAFSIDANGVDVKIIDGSFTQVGEIHTSYASADPISVVTFTKAAKLTMLGGTLSAENIGAGAAYGVDVQHGSEDVEKGSIFYMTGGDLTVTASSGNAQGAHVASTIDYATFNGGSMTVSAPTNAYGIWSAGQSNITNANISVETTTGANSYGVYVNGGTSTIGATDFTVNAKTTNAYGADVNAGRLNVNGGNLAATAIEDKVYGVYVAAGATAMLQQKAAVAATISIGNGSSDVEVCGINNLGTVSLYNISVTANSATNNATAVNTKTSAISTTIEGGTYRATATGTAYGLHHQYGTLTVDGGSFIAIGDGDMMYGGRAEANATIANATFHGETLGSGVEAYGFVGADKDVTISLNNCVLEAIANNEKAYAIVTRSNLTVTNCTLTATTNNAGNAYGVFVRKRSATLENCVATVTSNTTTAYGVNHELGTLMIEGGEYNVLAKQNSASAEQTANAYGLYNASSQISSVQNATFRVTSGNSTFSKDLYGAYINGTLNSSGATYSAEAKLQAYGIWGNTASTLNLSGNTISSNITNGTTSYGIYAKKNFTIDGDVVSAVGNSTGVYAMFFASTSNGDVLSGRFSAQGNGTNGYGALNADATKANVRLKGGVYKTTNNLQKYAYTGYQIYHLDGTHPDYADGYRYTIATENPSPYVCRIVNGAYYSTLEAALQYTQDHSGNFTIVMTQPYTLPAGDYVLPANATLIVPRIFGQTTITNTPTNNPDPAQPDKRNTVGSREEFLRLTMASDAHLSVSGKIGVSGEMYCQESGYISYNNSPYGHILMEEGSLIQLNNGARLYAWGFISGLGNIIVKSGAEVHEMFQVGDMKTVGNLADGFYGNSHGHFLINQYSIHNVAVPTTYYHNSQLICAMYNYYKGTNTYQGGSSILVVGTSGALFEVTSNDESSWVRKSYDGANDMQVWDVNSSAQLGSIEMTIASQSVNSLDYILPITSNMKIHILDGDFKITQSTEFLPGSQIEIDKTATLTINKTYKNSNKQTKNLKVYVFDKDQWPLTTASCSPMYSPSWPNGSKPSRTAGDAAINVHGNINIEGALLTSNKGTETSKTDGANIFSTNADAGTISFVETAPSKQDSIKLITGVSSGSLVTKKVTMDPAQLKNGTGASQAFTPTSGTDDGHAFAYINNEWTLTYTDGCFEIKGEHTYAKPGDYVELKKQREQETVGYDDMFILDNHTYLSIDESRIFIHLPDAEGNCQWWEVEKVEGSADPEVFECKKTGYEGFYYYNTLSDSWELKTVEVKFYAEETGDAVLKTIVTDFNGVPDQAVIASNPTKATTNEYTYQFYGWKSSVTGDTLKWTDQLEVATADMSYRPVFTKTKRNYTVTFVNAKNGANVPVEVEYGAHPSYDPIKDPTAQYTYYFQNWEGYEPGATLPAVTGATSYTAVWAQTVNKYSITWKNGDEVLETDTKQPYGTATAFNGTLPTKETDDNYVYAFSGWRSSLTGQTYANGSTPTVAGETTYEAQFNTTPRYAITFANYDGTVLQKEPVTAGAHPIYNGLTPGRARDLDGYFKFIGWKNSDGTDFAPNATLPEVTGKETYTAQYDYVTELYWITLHNVTGKNDLTDEDDNWRGKFGVESTPFYDPDNDDVADMPTKADGMEDGLMYVYTFSGWDPELQPVSGEAEYTAQFSKEVKKYNITFANLDGNGAQQTIEVAYGTTPVSPVEPAKGDLYCTYEFLEWDNTIVAVTGDATYTAQFSEDCTPRTFPITFDLDNGVDDPIVMNVAYGQTPTPEVPETWQDAAYIYTFSGWTPAIHAVDGPAEYTAQYTPTIRSYTIRFVNYDGAELQSSQMAYGATPTYSGTPTKPANLDTKKMYNFNGWSPAILSVTGDATYTAQYSEVDIVATVTKGDDTTPYSSWSSAYGARANNCTIKLYKDVTGLTTMQALDKTGMTLDLNGHTMSGTCANNSGIISVTAANVTITDSSIGKTGTISGSGSVNNLAYTLYINGGSLTIDYANVSVQNTRTNNASNAYAVNVNSGSVVINNGKFKATSSRTSTSGRTLNAVYIKSGQTATIKGGYYSNSVTAATGYQCVTTSEISGYTHKVTPKTNINYTVKHFQQNLENDQYTEFESETKQGTTATATAAEAKNYEGFTALPFEQGTIAGDGSTIVNIYYDRNTYTVIWKNGDATLETDENMKYGAMPSYDGATPTKANSETQTFVFSGWSPEVAEVNGDVTYSAQFKAFDLNLVVDEADEIDASISVTTTTVTVSGILEIDPGVTLTTTNLILEASESGSGQILDGGTINATNVYYDLTLNTAARHWHAFGVPWMVDLNKNPLTEVETGRTLTLGSNYEIVYYDTHTRATEGPGANCWKYLKHYDQPGQSIDVLNPGQGYMIAFTTPVQTVRFVKKSDAPIIFNGSVTVTAEGEGTDKGINAIANPMAYHANLNVAGVGQVHDGGEIGSDGYDPVTISNMNYIVGKTVYVQVDDAQTITPTNGISHAAAPVRRAAKATDKKYMVLEDYYTVELTNANGVGSKLYVLPEEDKEDKYVIGHDLVKMGMSTKKAQIWVNRYGVNLGLNTTAPLHETAEFPINLYVPVADDYTIGLAAQPDDEYTVYLTLNGEAIWNLSDAPYTISLNNGTTKGYGLRLSRKASQTPTGVDEAVVDAKGEIIKVLIEDKVFIIREGNVYSVDGQLVK